MRKLMMELEYDGSSYCGFQVQPEKPTVQGEVEEALYKLTGEALRITAAGRTDTGVHAKAQVVSFVTDGGCPTKQFVGALNFYLPDDICVTSVVEVPADFDARRSAIRRYYRYYVLNRRCPSPFWRHYAYHFPVQLDLGEIRRAASALVGEHDFAAFAGREAKGRSTRREIYTADVERQGELVLFDISANGFIAHQVRNMVGTLIWVGTGKLGAADLLRILEGRDRKAAGPAAPPHGLYFMKVDYPVGAFTV
ncbi:MAG: tRNA pseudouridine(38-40) synthase TruA [Dehalococcoidia bacterium]|nr:tRNA pseudouridine(38-40) synthase TruA [Dehalococcoidia bacterium]